MTFSVWLESELSKVKKDYETLPSWLKETFEKKDETKKETYHADSEKINEKKLCDKVK